MRLNVSTIVIFYISDKASKYISGILYLILIMMIKLDARSDLDSLGISSSLYLSNALKTLATFSLINGLSLWTYLLSELQG